MAQKAEFAIRTLDL